MSDGGPPFLIHLDYRVPSSLKHTNGPLAGTFHQSKRASTFQTTPSTILIAHWKRMWQWKQVTLLEPTKALGPVRCVPANLGQSRTRQSPFDFDWVVPVLVLFFSRSVGFCLFHAVHGLSSDLSRGHPNRDVAETCRI